MKSSLIRCKIFGMASLLAVFLLLGSSGCSQAEKPLSPRDPDLVIQLRWMQSYPSQSRAKANTGLFWALSFLGAKLPADAAIISWSGNVVTVDLDAAGVPQGSREAWKKLVRLLKTSDEYRVMGGMDMGRFVFLSLCGSQQYYALTGVTPTYAEFRARHAFAPRQVAIVESAVAHGNRLIEVGQGEGIDSVAFVAFEGAGALRDHTFQKADIETLDLMDNGQLRFGLYDLEGHLKETTTRSLTTAGKPSKCLWWSRDQRAAAIQECHGPGGLLQYQGIQGARERRHADHCQLPQDPGGEGGLYPDAGSFECGRSLHVVCRAHRDPPGGRMEHAARAGEATPGESQSQDPPASQGGRQRHPGRRALRSKRGRPARPLQDDPWTLGHARGFEL